MQVTTSYRISEGSFRMKIGMRVLYESEIYIIQYIYNSGYCEIKNINRQFNVLLVKLSELTVFKED